MLTANEKRIINLLLVKLKALRNEHSLRLRRTTYEDCFHLGRFASDIEWAWREGRMSTGVAQRCLDLIQRKVTPIYRLALLSFTESAISQGLPYECSCTDIELCEFCEIPF